MNLILIKKINPLYREKFPGHVITPARQASGLASSLSKVLSTQRLLLKRSPQICLSFLLRLSDEGSESVMKFLRAYFRLLVFGVSISIGMSYIMLVTLLRGKNLNRSMRIRRSWIKFISPVLGLKILNETTPARGNFLFIGNHRSFMDPVVILHHIYALPLAKSEVRSYPLIGYGAGITGVLYVVRESANSRLDARQAIASTLQEGNSVLVYPEGTTFNTRLSGPFKKGSFEIAALLDIPIIPVAIEYEDVQDHWKEKSLFQQYLYQFGKKESRCRIEYGQPITSDDPEKLLSDTKEWIDRKLVLFREEFDSRQAV